MLGRLSVCIFLGVMSQGTSQSLHINTLTLLLSLYLYSSSVYDRRANKKFRLPNENRWESITSIYIVPGDRETINGVRHLRV